MADGPVRVLLVVDDHDDYLRVRELFDELPADTLCLDRVATFDEALAAISDCQHDLFLVDYRLRSQTGLDLLARSRAVSCTAPMIMLTGAHEPLADLLATPTGAYDFLRKDQLDAATLLRTIRHALAHGRLEDEVRQANAHLEQRVRQRTAELTQLIDALRAEIAQHTLAENSLRDADRRKDEFLAALAHELRNPLAPISAAIQLIAVEPERSGQVRQLVGTMSQQLDQLVRLIDDLADVSRITSSKLRLCCEPAQLAEFVNAAIDQCRPLIESMQHTLDVSLPAEPLVIQGDKVRLAQIVGNLLMNAAKYTPSGGRVELSVTRDKGQAVLAVRDNGIGIPSEMQDRIFDLFAQVDGASPRSRGGLGIGLAIVKSLVELHGGSIAAASEGSGRGSQFTVVLPLTGVSDASRRPAPQPDEGEPLPALKILLVDDNHSAVHLMRRLLEKLGQEVHVADCGSAALVLAPQVVPDIIISDVAMPGMSGYDLAREIRGLDLPRRPYLVAITGYGQDSDKQEALAAGFDLHLTKPVGVATLAQLLHSRSGRP